MRNTFFVLILASLGQPLAAAPPPLSLSTVLQAVSDHDPVVAAARADAAMARGQALSAYAWPAPQLGLEWMGLDAVTPDLSNPMSRKLSLTQALPFPGRTWAAGRAASHGAEAAGLQARGVELAELEKARAAYFDLAAADYWAGALSRTAAATRDMAALSERRGAFGQLDRMGQFMDTMLGLSLAAVDAQRPDVRQQRLDAEARLRRLMGADDGNGEGAELGPVTVDVDAWLAVGVPASAARSQAQRDNPDLAAAQARLAQALAQRGLAWSGWLPDLMVQGNVTEDAQGARQGGAMLAISLPWLWGWKQAGEVSAADAAADSAGLAVEAERLRLRADLDSAIGELDAAREALRVAWTRARPRAEQGLALAKDGFRTTALGPTEIIMALQEYSMTQQTVAQLLARYGRAQATLDTLMGGPLAGAAHGDKP